MSTLFETAKRLFLEGTTALERGDLATAELNLTECLRLMPGRASTQANLAVLYVAKAVAALAQERALEAIAMYEMAIKFDDKSVQAYEGLGALLAEQNQVEKALACYDCALALLPDQPFIWINRASLLNTLGRYADAVASCDRSIAVDADLAAAWINRSNALNDLGRHEEALVSADRAISLDTGFPEAWINRGQALNDLKRYELALAAFDRASEIQSDLAVLWSNRGIALDGLRRHPEALASLDRALQLKPDLAQAWTNRGSTLNSLERYQEALDSHEQALRIKPDLVEAWTNRGSTLNSLRQYQEALDSYDQALRIKPDFAKAWINRGAVLSELKRYPEALVSHQRALEIDPTLDFALGELVHTQVMICDWTALDTRLEQMARGLTASEKISRPFAVLGALDFPALQLSAARKYVEDLGQVLPAAFPAPRPTHDRIRVGYFSMDFREHPVSALVVEMLERHDRSQFEIYAFAFGATRPGPMRERIAKAVDNFIDVDGLSDAELVARARHHQIDIAVDLAGHTHSSRPKIFMARVAPIQINYLGFPGTWGSDCMDYVIGDRVVITEQNKNYFSEKIIFMPDQFQVNPSERPPARASVSRGAYGIAEDAFVFCCFNNSWKFTPEVFQSWMRILKAVPSAVLWIYADNTISADNLRSEAAKQGVAPSRLIVAGRIPLDAYLARFTCADLFLDTWPYNAGTTASDALWAGLPVLTRAGASFASRMAASLLKSVRLPELITESGPTYEALAIELALHPERLEDLRKRLIENRSSSPLFDTVRFTENIERAFRDIHARSRAGLAPDHLDVVPAEAGT